MSLNLKNTGFKIVAYGKEFEILQEVESKRFYVRDALESPTGGYQEWSASSLMVLENRINYTLEQQQ